MKSTIVAILFALAFTSCSRANSVIIIDITTTDAATTYTVNNQQKTPTEIEVWFRELIKQFGDGDPIIVRPDKRTSFSTVYDILRRLKTAGVKSFEVIDSTTASGGVHDQHSLVGTADNIRHEHFTVPILHENPPTK